ncbi:hypothetical protein BACSP_00184 [Bacillus sp. T2.9-1]|nr:hypothetical protein BACSP_00184 [Bacillus sp. T2.9-1]
MFIGKMKTKKCRQQRKSGVHPEDENQKAEATAEKWRLSQKRKPKFIKNKGKPALP